MKILSQALKLCLLPTLIVGCSLTPPAKTVEVTDVSPEQLEKMNREALIMESERLQNQVEQAKASPESTTFLASDLFLKANMSLMEGDFQTASMLFKYTFALVPDDEFIQKKYAISLIRTGNLEEAQAVLEKLYGKSKDEKFGLILAGIYSGFDKEPKAQHLYGEILAKNPKSEDACIFLGKSLALNKQDQKALSILKKCAAHDKTNGMFDYYAGKILIDQGKVGQAIEAFKTAHEKQPSLTQAVSSLGILFEERERFKEAISVYKKHLAARPLDSVILNRVVQVLFLQEQYQEVIGYAERLSDIEPDNLNLKVKLGILYTDAKKYPEALSVFKDLLKTAPESDKILYYIGAIHQEMNQFTESIEYFNQIPSTSGLYPDSSVQMANMLSALAQAEYLEGRGDKKWKEDFLAHVNKKLAEFKDMQVEYSVIKAGFFEGTNQYKDAMEALMVVQDEKNFSNQHKYYLANLFEKEKKFEDSTSIIMGILEQEPKNAHAWNFLGYSLLARNEMDKAYEYIQRAYKIDPNDGYIRDSLGWYYYKKGDKKKALSELQVAHQKVPDDVEILKHMAIIHREMKDYGRAKNFLESALRHARYQNEKMEIISDLKSMDSERVPASGEID